jgi:hypothetical protein
MQMVILGGLPRAALHGSKALACLILVSVGGCQRDTSPSAPDSSAVVRLRVVTADGVRSTSEQEVELEVHSGSAGDYVTTTVYVEGTPVTAVIQEPDITAQYGGLSSTQAASSSSEIDALDPFGATSTTSASYSFYEVEGLSLRAKRVAGKILREVAVIDQYTGDTVATGRRLAYRSGQTIRTSAHTIRFSTGQTVELDLSGTYAALDRAHNRTSEALDERSHTGVDGVLATVIRKCTESAKRLCLPGIAFAQQADCSQQQRALAFATQMRTWSRGITAFALVGAGAAVRSGIVSGGTALGPALLGAGAALVVAGGSYVMGEMAYAYAEDELTLCATGNLPPCDRPRLAACLKPT